MEKKTMYPDMPELPGGMPDAPPTYNQSFPTAPSAEMAPMMMPSSNAEAGAGAMMVQPQQQQSFAQPQAILYQNPPPIPPLGPRPCLVTCPSCHHQAMSIIRMETATKTHLFAAILCLLGLCCCACIPYCVDNCKNPNHHCSKCDAYLGTYNK